MILDLMQDDQPRWTGVANLNGSEREIAAAKLLNVALTRAKTKLYLIGDWDFIRYCDYPGMRSLTNLANHPSFEIIEAGIYLGAAQTPRARSRVFETSAAQHSPAIVWQ